MIRFLACLAESAPSPTNVDRSHDSSARVVNITMTSENPPLKGNRFVLTGHGDMSGLIIAQEKGNALQVENLEPLQENRLPEGRTGEN